MSTNGAVKNQQAVSVSLDELRVGKFHLQDQYPRSSFISNIGSVSFEALEEAFGPSSLGIIVVKGLPDGFVTKRKNLLSYASYLANLPEDQIGSSASYGNHT